MSESAAHLRLVACLSEWIADEYFGGDQGAIRVDSPEASAGTKPPPVYGFVPDVYAMGRDGIGLVIGEAKTARDVENRHTLEQFTAFMKLCSLSPDSCLVIAVPWWLVRLARAMVATVERRQRITNVRVVVLDKLEG
jgi:hypothetical protein